jgi:hypothetical protein
MGNANEFSLESPLSKSKTRTSTQKREQNCLQMNEKEEAKSFGKANPKLRMSVELA